MAFDLPFAFVEIEIVYCASLVAIKGVTLKENNRISNTKL